MCSRSDSTESKCCLSYSHFLSINNTTGLQFANDPFTNHVFTCAVPAEGRWHSVPVTAKRNDPLGIK